MPDHSTYRGIQIWFEANGKFSFFYGGSWVLASTLRLAQKWIDEHMEEAGGDGYK